MNPFPPCRLPPAVVGVCRALDGVLTLPEAGPAPDGDLSLADVLAVHARMLAASVEEAAPGLMHAVREPVMQSSR
ncbi:hypothetical protein FV232_09740 [Methylobacterium sp. WL30]|uniref:hypothetical protein n=1 Tax=unclassified Methylobacterium TaxID=2615210 RepID=UPI0011C7DB5C|nr:MULTISPECIES: hypothetical protein [unclassified Methylobacterium]TXN41264.1 hypothetical protein FV225_03060 [Methylobacterium sp. WL93]TXN50949.1 hypothetical protein FV227_09815 [Methylobacterium sp. WL119]TXN68166.1 hypothetical protein FV232_09740 [Methylobacterium sp. WL30]TXN69154.1 hypothetical protein FV228_12950 [Methylobacterium sp. WL18]